MVTKVKDRYTPRFDLGSNLDPKNSQTGTISELLAEINRDYNPASGEPANFKSLKPTLEFIAKTTGTRFRNTAEQVPLLSLKTIKLLFMVNHENEQMNLLSRIEPPTVSGKATMESATGTSISRDKRGASVIQTLSNRLALEIEADKLESFYGLLRNSGKRSVAEELNAHIERTNDEISRLLISRLRNKNLWLANAYYRLARVIDSVRYTKVRESAQPPLNEAIFAHLQGLGFTHFALHHRDFIRKIRVSQTIHPIDTEVDVLCQSLSKAAGEAVLPHERLFSVNNFHQLVAIYRREFAALVRVATKLDTRKKVLLENMLRAKRILASHGYRCFDETNLDAPLLSVLDIVAALCSVRYQQKVKTEYQPYWLGQISQGKDPQRHFDKTIDPNDPYQHQGVFQIYFYRFSEYLAAFTRKTENNNAWMAYQISRFDAYTKILQLNDVNGIVTSAHQFDDFCKKQAREIADVFTSSVM